jgi:chromosome segregation ATPase
LKTQIKDLRSQLENRNRQEKLHETEISQLKTQIKELRAQLENQHRLSYQPYQQQQHSRYQPYRRPINQQRYQPQHQTNSFNTAQDQTKPPSSYDEQLLYEVIELVYGVTENVWTMF